MNSAVFNIRRLNNGKSLGLKRLDSVSYTPIHIPDIFGPTEIRNGPSDRAKIPILRARLRRSSEPVRRTYVLLIGNAYRTLSYMLPLLNLFQSFIRFTPSSTQKLLPLLASPRL